MYRILIIVVLVASVCAVDRDEFMKACGNMRITIKCCKDEAFIEPELLTVLKECSQVPGPPMCDQDICLATKRGYGSPNGKIDERKALREIEAYMKNSKHNIFDIIKQECFGNNMDKYGPADQCQAAKLRHCVRLQLLQACKNLSNEGSCQGARDNLENCLKLFM
ncbi:hypothetical protein ACJJTC_016692 [Scirpophaga incertulas]